ncbi:hypothetical protein GSI_00407 [Ganoderma sinense ZZ0214-1]|uniref:Uncharacterized protein n=1 Tax=Ganoderma sinense ZZ0214-1 TaxID=1077348 RepID=A0A2G8ST25_9APHY|nr:hypothetical protein GSI_00407 [Ganoderma sinense ZZ0214-1]
MSSNDDGSGKFSLWRPLVQLVSKRVALVLLPGILYGIFLSLALGSFSLLLTSKSTTRTVRLLLGFILFALWASTTAFLVFNSVTAQYSILQDGYIAWSSKTDPGYDGAEVVFLGNTIVWWRACALWRERARWPVRVVGGILVLAAFGAGIADISSSCAGDGWNVNNLSVGDGYIYEGFAYDAIPISLSLAGNFIATALTAGKACRFRSSLRKHLEAGMGSSRREKVAILLVESGLVYTLLWIVVAALYGAGVQDLFAVFDLLEATNLWTAYAVFLQGGIVPLVAIYPTVVIIFVALGRSQVDKEFWTSRRRTPATTTAPLDGGPAEMTTHDRHPILEKP